MAEIRFVESGELLAYRDAINFGFGQDPGTDDRLQELFESITNPETCLVAVDRGHIVATFGSYDLAVTVPGGATVNMAGTTHVTVHPTHRRQGILTRMMALHLDQARERGQPMAGLWASEEPIYGRFGYGPAIHGHELRLPARTVEMAPAEPGITVHPLTVAEARETLPRIYDRQLATAPAGWLVRSTDWWEARRFHQRKGAGPGGENRYVVAERDGGPAGYVIFKLVTPDSWTDGTTRIIELVAADDHVRRSLWNFATNIDLFRHVRWWNAPVDEPVLIEVDRVREITRSVMDSVWVRPLDITGLLSARRYERDGHLVIGVADGFGQTSGHYLLEVEAGVGHCRPVDTEPDVHMAVEDLGRLVMGGGSAVSLQRAGLVEGTPEAVAVLHDLLITRAQPHSPDVF